jgi:alkylhydroperoxidase/carboxymuconolactone decarboxylase family protein YurZ
MKHRAPALASVLLMSSASADDMQSIAPRLQTIELPFYLNLALDGGVRPREVAETITHLALYSGSSNAAVAVAEEVFAQRKIASDQAGQRSSLSDQESYTWN